MCTRDYSHRLRERGADARAAVCCGPSGRPRPRLDSPEERVAPSTEIVIGDVGAQHVLIRPVARSSPGLFDNWDANGLICEVELAAGGFRAAFSADMRSEEFQAFMDQILELERTVDGAATFATIEGQVALSLSADSNGRVRVAGEALDSPGDGNRLTFHFEIDRPDLSQISRAIGHLLAAYPVVEAPDA
jgi:hypothetical protein